MKNEKEKNLCFKFALLGTELMAMITLCACIFYCRALYGLISYFTSPLEFNSFVLAVMIVNFTVYLTYYVTVKVRPSTQLSTCLSVCVFCHVCLHHKVIFVFNTVFINTSCICAFQWFILVIFVDNMYIYKYHRYEVYIFVYFYSLFTRRTIVRIKIHPRCCFSTLL